MNSDYESPSSPPPPESGEAAYGAAAPRSPEPPRPAPPSPPPPQPPRNYASGDDGGQKPRKSSSVAVLVVLGVLAFFAACIALGVFVALAGGGSVGGNLQAVTKETVLPGTGLHPPVVAVVSLAGVIGGGGSYVHGEGMVYEVAQQLREAAADAQVRAVLLQIDSPGGFLSASDILYNEVRKVRDAGKKVVVLVGSIAASGGYYVAAPADYIVAGPTSMVGSFGIIMPRFQVAELMDKIGVKAAPLKSAEMKDMGSPFRELTPEERDYFLARLEHYHGIFVRIIATGRNLGEEEVRPLADGRVYTSDQALEYKLIDEVGYFDAALRKAKELAGIVVEPRVVVYKRSFSLSDMFRSRFAAPQPDARTLLREALLQSATPRVLALWTGGVPGETAER